MEKFYQILKMFFVFAFSLGQLFAPKIAGGDFPQSGPASPGDETKYLQIDTVDEGFDTFRILIYRKSTKKASAKKGTVPRRHAFGYGKAAADPEKGSAAASYRFNARNSALSQSCG